MTPVNERNALISHLYNDMYNTLFAIAQAYVGTDDAYDIVQKTFVIALEKYNKLAASDNPQRWLTATLKYVICRAKRDSAIKLLRTTPISDVDMDNSATQALDSYSPNFDEYEFELDDFFIRAVGEDAYALYKDVCIHKLSKEQLEAKYQIGIAACRNRASMTKKKMREAMKNYF